MEKIVINHIIKHKNIIEYDFCVSDRLKKIFSGKPFIIEYPESIEMVPDSVAIIPFVCNVLPIIWLTNAELVVDSLDKTFYESISKIKNGYEEMFPESDFLGKITVSEIIECKRILKNKCAAFYSGGVDSMHTLLSHKMEKPDLISIWGSDISYDNEDGWNLVHKAIEEAAKKYNLKDVVIRSTFREYDREGVLDKNFCKQLKDGWWHGVKHGLGLLGHVAPYAYMHGITTMYIASSNCSSDKNVRCASDPRIDNQVKFAECQVVHDGYEFNRQDKLRNIAKYNSNEERILPLHVCWESQLGNNCCRCEKCYRTIVGLIIEKEDPIKYGFFDTNETIKDIKKSVIYSGIMNDALSREWRHIQKRIIDVKKELKSSDYWKCIKWIEKINFQEYQTIKKPLVYRIKKRLYRIKILRVIYRKIIRIVVSK